MIPVESRLSRLRSTSSADSGIICTTPRALVVPSMRESTKPSAGESVSFWKRSSGSDEWTAPARCRPAPRGRRGDLAPPHRLEDQLCGGDLERQLAFGLGLVLILEDVGALGPEEDLRQQLAHVRLDRVPRRSASISPSPAAPLPAACASGSR